MRIFGLELTRAKPINVLATVEKITAETPIDVAKAIQQGWQRSKEFDLRSLVAAITADAENKGLDRRRIARILGSAAIDLSDGPKNGNVGKNLA